ncbi:phosphoenolpyruvate--protein phosphotransferase [Inquilinus sp. OTU3971]|uniref:phosphoenolpyruvate--protein phosphotransferase n=1 Tax=Inquilinus sp. OTU3971 TaxID=3043855 RepID=UPI00313A7689
MPPRSDLAGRPAAPGLAIGPVVRLAKSMAARRSSGDPMQETEDLLAAIEAAIADLATLTETAGEDGAGILEFQVAMLEDEALREPALAVIAAGAAADAAWRQAVEIQIAEYETAGEEYFQARTADLTDLRDRVLGHLAGMGDEAPPPSGAVLVAEDLTPSRFLATDWTGGGAIALAASSPTSHVAMLARSRRVPMVVGLGAAILDGGTEAIVDGSAGTVWLDPPAAAKDEFRRRRAAMEAVERAAEATVRQPAVTRGGVPIAVLINLADPAELGRIDPAICDGVGLVRTEFLFHGGGLPDEARQVAAYSRIVAWAQGRPVTIRTLDAGGDKPIPGLTVDGESNPFLGTRGIRLSLARPGPFRIQLRALARAAVHGPLKIMIPMVTVPAEMAAAGRMLDDAVAELTAAGIPARRPPLGMMVEVPAAALAIDRFVADFLSIGSNDLTQYVTAAARDTGAVADLADPGNPAVLRLIAEVAAAGARQGIEVSLCGDMAGDPAFVPALLRAGLRSLSMAPAAVARTKAAIAAADLGA